jgi:recombination associated protein RdgC
MWFKNLRVYRLLPGVNLTAESLQSALEGFSLKPCGKLEPASAGWTSPYGREHQSLVHAAAGCFLIRYGVQEKVLPAAVIKDAMEERLAAARARTGAPAGRQDKLRMRDEVLMDLLPRAFVKPRSIDAYLDSVKGWLIINTSSARQADEIAALLRQSIGDLKLLAPDLVNRIRTRLTTWLETGACPGELGLGDECDLQDESDQGATVKCRHQDLTSREVAQHLKAGKRAMRIGLIWSGRLGFAFSDEFCLQRIKYLEVMQDQLDDLNTEDEMAELDAQFALMTGEFQSLLGQLSELFEWQ